MKTLTAINFFINESFYNMRCLVMFITAICVLFLLKLKWPKNKSVYDDDDDDDDDDDGFFPRVLFITQRLFSSCCKATSKSCQSNKLTSVKVRYSSFYSLFSRLKISTLNAFYATAG